MITLLPMSELDYRDYVSWGIPLYAREKASQLLIPYEEALKISHSSFHEVLPEGLHTKNHYLLSIMKDESAGGREKRKVGILWFGRYWKEGTAYIYDFHVDEKIRGQGLGAQALLALEEMVRALGMDKVELHVFAHNPRAHQLYRRLGYEDIGDQHMVKNLKAVS